MDQRKKILFVITKSNFGGAQRYVYELATGIDTGRFEPVAAMGGDGLLAHKLRDAGVRVHTIKNFARDINLIKEVRAMVELARVINAEHPDIVHLNSSKAGGSGALIARLMGVPKVIFTAHGWPFFEDRNVLWRTIVWILSWITALLSHTVILVSAHDLTRTHMPLVGKKLKLVRTAVPEIHFKARDEARAFLFGKEECARHTDHLYAVSTGEHTKNKNLIRALHALKIHNDSHPQKIFLTFMNNGEDRHALEEYAKNEHIDHMVHFTGFIDDARSYLSAFDIFLMPSLKEGLPYGLLEAGAAGLACIGSKVGGIPEIITHGVTGILIDPRDINSLSNALATLTTSAETRAQYGDALKQHVEQHYTLHGMITNTEKLY